MLQAKTLAELNKGVAEFAPDLQATQDKLGATLRDYLASSPAPKNPASVRRAASQGGPRQRAASWE